MLLQCFGLAEIKSWHIPKKHQQHRPQLKHNLGWNTLQSTQKIKKHKLAFFIYLFCVFYLYFIYFVVFIDFVISIFGFNDMRSLCFFPSPSFFPV